MLKKGLIECDFVFKSTFMFTFPGAMVHGKSPEEQMDIATDKFAGLRLVIYKEIQSGNLHIKAFNYFICWEFRPNTGDIHAHLLTDTFILKHTMTKLLRRAGMGEYNYLQGLKKSENPKGYRQAVKYAAAYVYKGGWDAVRGRRRYSMSKAVAESVNRWIKANKKPFNGEIVSHEEVAVLNRDRYVTVVRSSGEDLVAPGHYLYESPIRLDMVKVHKFETSDPKYKKIPAKREKPSPDQETVFP